MPRPALLISLALHAGLLTLAGWYSLFVTRFEIPPGRPDATFLFGQSNSLLIETAPPAPADAAPPQLVEPEFTPPPPVTEPPPAPVTPLTFAPTPLPAPILLPPDENPAPPKAPSPPKRKPARSIAAQSTGNPAATGRASGASDGAGSRGAGYIPPQFRLRYTPPYPAEARARRLEGTVVLLVSIDAEGRVTSVSLARSCGHSVLDTAALSAVRSWRFDPARQGGVAVAARAEVPVRFRFEEGRRG